MSSVAALLMLTAPAPLMMRVASVPPEACTVPVPVMSTVTAPLPLTAPLFAKLAAPMVPPASCTEPALVNAPAPATMFSTRPLLSTSSPLAATLVSVLSIELTMPLLKPVTFSAEFAPLSVTRVSTRSPVVPMVTMLSAALLRRLSVLAAPAVEEI